MTMAPSQSPSTRKRRDGATPDKPPKLNRTKRPKSSREAPSASHWESCLWATMKYILYACGALMVPPILNLAALNQEETVIKQNGGLPYDIGWNQNLFLNCTGEGSPTVILEAPVGQSSEVWYAVQPALAAVTRVCSYDRAGLGLSDRPYKNSTDEDQKRRGPESTVERMVTDLHYLITASSDQPKPFILVGAEMGSIVARFYAQLYEEEVSDVVLVDPLVEVLFEEEDGVWKKMWYGHTMPYGVLAQLAASTGLTRIGLILKLLNLPIKAQDIPEEVILRQKHLMCRPSHQSASVDEHYFINETFSQIRTAYKVKPFPESVSVTIVTGNYHDDELPNVLNEAWEFSLEFLESIHPDAKRIRINGSDGHMIYRRPGELVDIVKKLVRRWRDSNRPKGKPAPTDDS